MAKQNSITASMIWKTLERYAVLGSQMLVQIVIARLVTPKEYGVVSMMTVFISIATVFIQNGFNMALVQKKDATEKDAATAFSINLLIGIGLYLVLFFASPAIANFYHEEQITSSLRVLGLILIIGSVNSIQVAVATRNMKFDTLFAGNIAGSVVSGIIGIGCAFLGMGVWALVIQQLMNKVVVTLVLTFMMKWKPVLTLDKISAKSMFSYGWKLLAASMINQIYNELNNLVIGRKYTSGDLAFYNKGKQFPYYVTTGIDGSIQSVMFSAFSKKQTDLSALQTMLRKSISVNTYIIFPLMAGMALIAEPLTVFLLTEKWLPIVPYLQICCLKYALHPIESAHLQAVAAIGRSDVRLKLEFIKKPVGIILLILAVPYGPFAVAMSAIITGIIGFFVNVIASRIYVRISFGDQIKDLIPPVVLTALMGVVVYFVSLFDMHYMLTLVLQVIAGMIVYILASALLKPEGFKYIFGLIKKIKR